MIVVVARYRTKPGEGDAVADALKALVPQVEREPGNLLYLVNRSQEDPEVFVLYEQYRGQDDLDEHLETSHYQEIVEERVKPLLEEREVMLYDLIAPES